MTSPVVFAFVSALLITFALTPVARRLAVPLGFVDRPGPRKIHLTPTPLMGGAAIYVGTVLATIVFSQGTARGQILAILTGTTLLLVVGMLDDKKVLHSQLKLMGAMPLAAVILLANGIHANVFPWSFADYAVTLIWIVGLTASFNILDHMDGLCAGLAAIASAFFVVFAVLGAQYLVAPLAAAVLGASLGFLRWNFKPAKIFMGDGGALLLGFLLATLGAKLRMPAAPAETGWMIPVLVLGVPIFDTTLVTISRLRRGLLPFASPGKDHTAHRLAELGLGQRGAVLVLYAAAILCGLLALSVGRLPVVCAYSLGGIVVILGLLAIVLLERAAYERQEQSSR
jgi:UDP-GlcNAc:undecaprenyl-phosphate/decaprenyl-phosphate GlcNAc-1-phosphate transferase